ncbi:hypothetical protein CGZ90_04400 [Fictibacillus aquaticus]|uniref:Uncharacterized protein n=1 Tax=Fictibacillus aquaticus TaxID=2021314 RepID=A0A235FDX7_9BACL|nr:hypothetical protein CGZ90_04400 [Fictibacillus aquaticus]
MDVKVMNNSEKNVDVLIQAVGTKNGKDVRLFQYLNSVSAKNNVLYKNLDVDYDSFSIQISSTSIQPHELTFEVIGRNSNSAVRNLTGSIKFVE